MIIQKLLNYLKILMVNYIVQTYIYHVDLVVVIHFVLYLKITIFTVLVFLVLKVMMQIK